MNVAINVENLSVNYDEKNIIHSFNLNIQKKTFFAIVGHNGCGKSTLLNTISDLQKSYSGSIKIFNKDLRAYDNVYKSGVLSYLSQNNQIGFDIKVKELLLMGRYRLSTLFSNYSEEDVNLVFEVASDLGIIDFLDKSFLELSGGEQQMVLFAQIILQDAEIIILDEPTQNLDIRNGFKIIKYLNCLVIEKNKTVVISTHDLHHLSEIHGFIYNMSTNTEIEVIDEKSIQRNSVLLRN